MFAGRGDNLPLGFAGFAYRPCCLAANPAPGDGSVAGSRGGLPVASGPRVFFIDPLFLLFILPGLLLSLWASFRVRSAFSKYKDVPASRGLTGAQVAETLLRSRGTPGVRIEATGGRLTDHYDPRNKVLRLSRDVYASSSLAAVGVAAHEAGHAIQHAEGYTPMKFRSAIVGPANFGSNLGFILALVGLLIGASQLVWLGCALFGLFVLFTLATLPVEFDASRRAIGALREQAILSPKELEGASTVLRAAGMTYLAAAATAVLQLAWFAFAASAEE